MKKLIICVICAICGCMSASAQKFALVDMEYIFKNIPAYERANEQLNQVSKKWQAEVDALTTEAQTLYKNYQNEVVFLSKEQKKAKQDAIVDKEKEAADLKKKYFGPEGELYKKRTALMTPIQEEVYNAIKDVADLRGYQLVLDRASDAGIICLDNLMNPVFLITELLDFDVTLTWTAMDITRKQDRKSSRLCLNTKRPRAKSTP